MDLSNNLIEYLPDDICFGKRKYEMLNLGSNLLTSLPKECFGKMLFCVLTDNPLDDDVKDDIDDWNSNQITSVIFYSKASRKMEIVHSSILVNLAMIFSYCKI